MDPAVDTSAYGPIDQLQILLKRGFDLVIGAAALIIATPVWLGATLAILWESGRPIFYRSTRVGTGGEEFELYKFRSMVEDARQKGSPLTVEGDPRVTKVGAFLRRWRIDELPNLLNVLRGQMSIVGPRPESPKYVDHYTFEQRRVLQVKPGVTDVEFVKDYKYEEEVLAEHDDPEEFYISELMPKKVALNLEYVDRYPSLIMDLKILLLSIWTGIFGESII